jgi:hypothetical protein
MEGTRYPKPRHPWKRGTPWSLRPWNARPASIGVVAGRRYYSPGIGRWTSRDPIGERGGASLYCFVLNGPVMSSDVLGRALFIGCSSAQQVVLQAGLTNVCTKIIDQNAGLRCCLGAGGVGNSRGLAECLRRKCSAASGITFVCEPATGRCASACAWTKPWGRRIHICPLYWQAGCALGSEMEGYIIAHELAHTCFGTERKAGLVEECVSFLK